MKTPTIKELAELFKILKPTIDDDYRADEFDDSDTPSMCVTIGSDSNGRWNYQTGDNSFTGGAYGFPYWAVVTLTRRTNCRELAREAIDQIAELQAGDEIP